MPRRYLDYLPSSPASTSWPPSVRGLGHPAGADVRQPDPRRALGTASRAKPWGARPSVAVPNAAHPRISRKPVVTHAPMTSERRDSVSGHGAQDTPAPIRACGCSLHRVYCSGCSSSTASTWPANPREFSTPQPAQRLVRAATPGAADQPACSWRCRSPPCPSRRNRPVPGLLGARDLRRPVHGQQFFEWRPRSTRHLIPARAHLKEIPGEMVSSNLLPDHPVLHGIQRGHRRHRADLTMVFIKDRPGPAGDWGHPGKRRPLRHLST